MIDKTTPEYLEYKRVINMLHNDYYRRKKEQGSPVIERICERSRNYYASNAETLRAKRKERYQRQKAEREASRLEDAKN
jgi:hypothetical protein